MWFCNRMNKDRTVKIVQKAKTQNKENPTKKNETKKSQDR